MPVTMVDVARATGLSQPAVSLALRGRGGVSEATRLKVLRAARDLGYRPHSGARSVLSGRFNVQGLILSTDRPRSQLPHDLLAGIESELSERGQHLVVGQFADDQLTSEDSVPRILKELTCDGLLINYNAGVPQALCALIDRFRIPAVWINAKFDHDCVFPDDYSAARRAAELLIERGHRRIAFVYAAYHRRIAQHRHFSGEYRLNGYRDAMLSRQLEPITVFDDSLDSAESVSYGEQCDRIVARLCDCLRAPQRVTGFVLYGGEESLVWQAIGLCGLSVPRDVSIVTFGDQIKRRETCMIVPNRELGRLAAVQVLEKLASPSTPLPAKTVPFGFSEGWTLGSLQTTGASASARRNTSHRAREVSVSDRTQMKEPAESSSVHTSSNAW